MAKFDVQGYMFRKLMDDMFGDKTAERNTEANTISQAVSTAGDEETFKKLGPVLDEYWKRNDSYSPSIQVKEIEDRATYNLRSNEMQVFKKGHIDAIGMTSPDYKISATDVDGGIQNVIPSDVASWNHLKITEELGKVNRIADSLALKKKNYHYAHKDSSQTTDSLTRDILQYKNSLLAGLDIAIETDEIPDDDDILLRGIVSGQVAKVKEHSGEQRTISAERYKGHDSNIDQLENALDTAMSMEHKTPQDLMGFLVNSMSGKSGEYMASIISDTVDKEGFDKNYNVYAGYLRDAITDELALREKANKRHKKYSGKLYEDTDISLEEKMGAYAEAGYEGRTKTDAELAEEARLKAAKEEARLAEEKEAEKARLEEAEKARLEEEARLKALEKTRQALPDTSVVSMPESTSTSYERQQAALARERKAQQKRVTEFNKESLARQIRDAGEVTQAPFQDYLQTLVAGEETFVSEVPKSSKDRYEIDREIRKTIKIDDSRIAGLYNNLNTSGISKNNFAKSIIKAWHDLDYDTRYSYASFSNFIKAILEDFITFEEGRDLKIEGMVR